MNERATTNEESTAGGHRARLRQRLLDGGPEGFHDYELVEYLLTLTIPRVDTKPLAKSCWASSEGSDRCYRRARTRSGVRASRIRPSQA